MSKMRIAMRAAVVCALTGSQAHPQPGRSIDAVSLTAPLAVTHATQIPGKILRPGTYTIRMVDHLTDRVILEVQDAQGRRLSTFLGLDSAALRPPYKNAGPLLWANGPNDTDTLRGYCFPGGTTVEFVYPKEAAVAIAKLNAASVAAIDPASEHKVAAEHLSADDLETITLWTLSATRVGPEASPGRVIAAERYHPPQPPATVSTRQAGDARAPGSSPNAVLSASVRRPGPIGLTALPHTASMLPSLCLAAVGMVLAGLTLHTLRLVARG